jgi:hypothetical protein
MMPRTKRLCSEQIEFDTTKKKLAAEFMANKAEDKADASFRRCLAAAADAAAAEREQTVVVDLTKE